MRRCANEVTVGIEQQAVYKAGAAEVDLAVSGAPLPVDHVHVSVTKGLEFGWVSAAKQS
jgi:hypothetical protein